MEHPLLAESWKESAGRHFSKIHSLKKILPEYSYKTRERAVRTDEKLCALLIRRLKLAKKKVYDISDLCFSLQTDQPLGLADQLKDELDILADEIFIRHHDWKDPVLLDGVVTRDARLVDGVKSINQDLLVIWKTIVESKNKRTKHGLFPKAFLKKLDNALITVRKKVLALAILFKEREALINIHPITLQKTFESMQKEIREKSLYIT